MNETMSTLPEWMQDRLVDRGIEDGIEWVVLQGGDRARLNGYARVPEGNPWFGLDYSRIKTVSVHGGLTYGDDGWIGFDTAHAGDNWPGMDHFVYTDSWAINWTLERIVAEAKDLARQVAAAPEADRPQEYPDHIVAVKDAAWKRFDEENGYNVETAFDEGFAAGWRAALGMDE